MMKFVYKARWKCFFFYTTKEKKSFLIFEVPKWQKNQKYLHKINIFLKFLNLKKNQGEINLLHLSVRWNECRKYSYFQLFWFLKKSKVLDGTFWYVKRCAFNRRFQKYVTFINRFIRGRVIAETLKLKKTELWFFDHKRVCFQYFQKQKKLHSLQLHTLFSVYELQ